MTDKHETPYTGYLNTILRLRLLRNTTKELSEHTGIQLQNNSFKKKTKFIARCIYSEFCREVQERININLDLLLSDYKKASCYYEKIANTKKAQPDFHLKVLYGILNPHFSECTEAAPYRSAIEEMNNINITIITLLILKVIPTFNSRAGDTCPNMHLKHLSQIRNYLQQLYIHSFSMPFAPFLTDKYKISKLQIRNGELFTRLDLISFTNEIISNLINNYDQEQLYYTNTYLDQQKIHPNLNLKLWKEHNQWGSTLNYWEFESIGKDFILTHYSLDRKKKEISVIRYELFIYQEKEKIVFALVKQSAFENLYKNKPLLEQDYMNGFLDINDCQNPSKIKWHFYSNRYDHFPITLIRTDIEHNDMLSLNSVDDSWTITYKTGIQEYLSTERVITNQYIYISNTIDKKLHRESGMLNLGIVFPEKDY